MRERVGDWIQTFTGRAFYPLDPDPEDVSIEDIAHALAHTCRFGGHSQRFYSVAEHSILVSRRVSDPTYALWGLLHDAAEAYLTDMPRPLKRFAAFEDVFDGGHISYSQQEARLMDVICDRFSLSFDRPNEIGIIDAALLREERDALLAPCAVPWGDDLPFWPITNGVYPVGLGPRTAELLFLERFRELTA